MRLGLTAVAVAAALVLASTCDARSSSHSGSSHDSSTSSHYGASTSSHHSSSSTSHSSGHKHGKADPGVKRDSHGHIARSEKSKDQFRKSHPCPSTGKTHGSCPGYVIDHKQALKHGGADESWNMQWQTEAAAKQKDTWE